MIVDMDGDGDLDIVHGPLQYARQEADGRFVFLEGDENPFKGISPGPWDSCTLGQEVLDVFMFVLDTLLNRDSRRGTQVQGLLDFGGLGRGWRHGLFFCGNFRATAWQHY